MGAVALAVLLDSDSESERQAEAKLRRIVNQYGVPPASARNLQTAIVQGAMLYASELT